MLVPSMIVVTSVIAVLLMCGIVTQWSKKQPDGPKENLDGGEGLEFRVED